MKKVLIVAGELKTGEYFQQVLSKSGFQTALVWNSVQVVDFCSQNDPDVTVVDLDLAGNLMWNALQAVKGMGSLANMPVVGISTALDPTELADAKQAGLVAAYPKQDGPEVLAEILKDLTKPGEEVNHINPSFESLPSIESHANIAMSERETLSQPAPAASASNSLSQLKGIIGEILTTTASLKNRVQEFGEDGPELFGYIQGSGGDIDTKVGEIGETSLYDHELRHDFRNMIGSVTGFSELILMESGLSPESQKGLTRLRECSRDFVELLDQQKELAEA